LEINGLFRGSIPLLNKAMDLRTTRHGLITSNIANLDTPQYKAFDLMVEDELEKVAGNGQKMNLHQTRSGHLPPRERRSDGIPGLVEIEGHPFQSVEGNTVDIDRTMSDLTENSLKYNATARILSKKFQGMKSVIQGGGK